jgi:hypothetical protein
LNFTLAGNNRLLDAKKLFCKQKPLLKNAYAIAKGTGIIFIGTIIGMFLGFACRVINFIFIYTMLRLGGVRDVHNCVKR